MQNTGSEEPARITLYETPEGAISVNHNSRTEIAAYREQSGLIVIKISSKVKDKDRDYWQAVKIDDDMARHLSAIIYALTKN